MSKQYLLDSNAFIDAKNRYYGFDICPGFWNFLLKKHQQGTVFSIDHVRTELSDDKYDDLSNWVKQSAPKSFFHATGSLLVQADYKNIITYVNESAQYREGAKADFAKGADGWLVAYAMQTGAVLVTQEVNSPQSKKHVPIPNVCLDFEVDFINVFDMLNELKASFVDDSN